jgi:phenylacetate-CoA ligase
VPAHGEDPGVNQWLAGRVLFPLHERLKRKPTFTWLRDLERTQWLPPDRLREYQFGRLRRLIEWAYARVPFYRELMDEHGLPPARLQSPDDFHRLPPLTRDVIRARFEDLRARAKLPGVHRRSSGGSTGAPVTIEVDMGRMGMAEGARLRALRWFAVNPGEREALIWGSPLEITRQDRVRDIRDWLLNSKILPAFDMGEDKLPDTARALLAYRPAKIYGYANAVYLLARYFRRERLPRPDGLRVVFTTAEPLFPFQREAITAAFGCPVAEEYGCRDGGLVALGCPAGGLHIVAEGSYVEILNPDASGRGEILLTCLDSLAFPTVRYRTGDIGAFDPSPCACGRSLPKLHPVEGRLLDFLVTPGGRMLHPTSAMHILRDIAWVRESRVIQEAVDHLVVQLVTEHPLSPEEELGLLAKFRVLLGEGMRVDIVQLAALPPSASGKFRPVESRVGRETLEAMMSGRS